MRFARRRLGCAVVTALEVTPVLIGFLNVVLVSTWLVASAPQTGAAQHADALAARGAQGAAAMEAGRFDEAASIYNELVAARPGDPGLQMNLGMARYMAGRPADALLPLQQAIRLKPALAPASLFLGAALLDLGRAEEAVVPLERAVKAMPQNPSPREMLARARFGLARFASAAADYRALTTIDGENPKAWYGLARSYQGLAEQAFAALQREAPDSPLIELLFAEVLVSEVKYAGALRIYRRALERPLPVGGVHEAVAELYERAGRSDWAALELQNAARRSPAECSSHRAECEFLAGRFRQALAAARQSSTPVAKYWAIRAANRLATGSVARLETLPPSVELHLIRAEIAQSNGRDPEAVTEIRAALTLAPGDATVETALAEALLRARDLVEALPLLERLTRQQPEAAQLLFLYGDALLQSQQLERAIQLLERTVKADPSFLPARRSLGRAYAQAGRFDAALPYLEAAAAEDDDGDVHYQLARAYQALDRPADAQKAMTEYQKRHQTAPQPSETQEPALTPPQ